MTIKEIRRRRLRTLIDERFSKKTIRFANALDMKPSQVYRWLREGTGGQGMEENSARAIEKKLGLEPGWLDRETDTPSCSPEIAEFLNFVNHDTPIRDISLDVQNAIKLLITSSPKKTT